MGERIQPLRDQRPLRILRGPSNACKVTFNTMRTHLALNYSILTRSLSASPLWRSAAFSPLKSRPFLVCRPRYFCGVFPLSRFPVTQSSSSLRPINFHFEQATRHHRVSIAYTPACNIVRTHLAVLHHVAILVLSPSAGLLGHPATQSLSAPRVRGPTQPTYGLSRCASNVYFEYLYASAKHTLTCNTVRTHLTPKYSAITQFSSPSSV